MTRCTIPPTVRALTDCSRLSGSSAATCASAEALLVAALGCARHLCCTAKAGTGAEVHGHDAGNGWLLPVLLLPRAPMQQLAAVRRSSTGLAPLLALHLLMFEAAEAAIKPVLQALPAAECGGWAC